MISKRCPWRKRNWLGSGENYRCNATREACTMTNCAPYVFAAYTLQLADDVSGELLERIRRMEDGKTQEG